MKKIKKSAAFFLVICVLVELLINVGGIERKAEAAVINSGNFSYEGLSDGTVKIVRYTGGDCDTLVIPSEIDGKKVSEIGGDVFYENYSTIDQVIISDGVSSIANGAFSNALFVRKVEIPDSVSNISEGAFYNCRTMETIDVSTGNSNYMSQNGVLYTKDQSKLLNCPPIGHSGVFTIPSSVNRIGNWAFGWCEALVQIVIPEQVTQIGSAAFVGCTGITELSIPHSVEQIGINFIRDCSNLEKIRVDGKNLHFVIDHGVLYNINKTKILGCPAKGKTGTYVILPSVQEIESGAFAGCSSLKELYIPVSVSSIGNQAFMECTQLQNVYYAGTQEQWNQIGIDGNQILKRVNMHYEVASEPEGDYEYNILEDGSVEVTEYLGSDRIVEMPAQIDGKRVTSIGQNAFSQMGIQEIIISENVTSIGSAAFEGCEVLQKVTIPDSVTSIKSGAFAWSGLQEINIPESVASIGVMAFGKCESLTDVYYSGTRKQWNQINIASGSGLEEERITIHFREEDETENEYEYKILDDKTIEIAKYNGADTVLLIPEQIEERRVIRIGENAFSGCTSLIEAVIPSGVITIGWSAFSGCTNLVKIDFPDRIAEIEGDAFMNCTGLKEIDIPSGLDHISDGTFAGCTGLTKLCIPSNITNINDNAFSDCAGLTEVEIQNGVINIGSEAFSCCTGLKEIDIPESVARIEGRAFEACDSLEDVYYAGTKEQWNKIKIEAEGNEKLLTATIHFKDSPIVLPEEPIQPEVRNPKEELENLKSNGTFQLDDFKHYLTEEQLGIMEDYLYTWLAQVNYAYQYSGSSTVKELIMKKVGIDPDGDFASGMEQAITHISVNTKYGTKTFEITMGLGQPDSSGNLYPGYSVMHYEVLEKSGVPSDVPVSGQIVRDYYADMGAFVESVKRASEDSLHGTYQWQQLEDEMTAGVLIDKTAAEIVGNKNGSFSDGTFTIYAQPLFAYSKIVKISCPVDVHVYGMDGQEAGSIVDNKPSGGNQHVRMDVDGDTKTVYLAGDDYYLNLRGTGTGTMKYEVEEIANEEVRRNVQFLELQLKNDMLYEGYVFRPLNIDRDLYELRAVEKNGSGGEVFRADEDSYQPSFKKVQGLSLSQKNTTLESNHTVQLSASHYPLDASNPNLRWATDNESVARVDKNGLVTAVGSGRAGRATVTVSTKDGSFLKQFCVIDVAQRDDGENGGSGNGSGSGSGDNNGNGSGGNGDSSSSNGGGSGNDSNGGNSSGNNSSTGGNSSSGGNSSGSSGNSSGSNTAAGQDKPPVVVSLHYVLQFHANGGTNLSRRTMTLLADDSPGIMPKVQRKDYTFDGWYTKQEGGTRVAGDEPLKEAATLYARWTKAQAPAKVSALSLKSKKKGQLQASFQKVKGAAGYQVSYSGSKKFTSEKTKEAGAAVKTKTVTGLKAGKKYYVRVRAYCLDSAGNRIYGAYSAVKSVKTKM
ncbi:MAG: leucine-rich repeat protein [Eubacterium sp.]|nr:leucine-rich repeat protein [Eubacterium sp.]